MNRFDFTKDEYDHFIEQCPFSEEEIKIFSFRRLEKSIKYMSVELDLSERTINRRIKSIARKILKVI